MLLLLRLQYMHFFHLLEGEDLQCIVFYILHQQDTTEASDANCCECFQIFKLNVCVLCKGKYVSSVGILNIFLN